MKNTFVKYEFKVVDLTHPSIDVEATLNNFGQLGFKVVSEFTRDENVYIVLQKEISE